MEEIILEISRRLAAGEHLGEKDLVRIIHAEAKRAGVAKSDIAKRKLLPFYQQVKAEDPDRWRSWGITPDVEAGLVALLRMKPRRSASGVATITVITKPWPCSGDCLFCPSDLRCPKSYLHNEPACARAEQNFYDPYLQVSARLTALSQMGHATDKIELIVLGGTWSDYPEAYQIWFMEELFRALNDDAVAKVAANPMISGASERPQLTKRDCPLWLAGEASDKASARARAERVWNGADAGDLPPEVVRRRDEYLRAGVPACEEERSRHVTAAQAQLEEGKRSYNACVRELYGPGSAWAALAPQQTANIEELELQQRANETAKHRVVGLVIETRPDAVGPRSLALIRRLGCTKIQMGVQSVSQRILNENERGISVETIASAFKLARLFGFKTHAHFMLNLKGATPQADAADYQRFVSDPRFLPDEVKLYPCALIGSSRLRGCYEAGTWSPYSEEELVQTLADDVLTTPAYCRVSRMIRDFSSNDIMVGNKKPNLRQLVEARLGKGAGVQEIRYREMGTKQVDLASVQLECIAYEPEGTSERFFQWVAPNGTIAGFLRLSLPNQALVEQMRAELPIGPDEAMIREVHVYGMATAVGAEGAAAQHHGLGRRLVEAACAEARRLGYTHMNVISAVGTREYYRGLGFSDHGLYLQKEL